MGNLLYINYIYCYSFKDFEACLKDIYPQKNPNNEMNNLVYWLEPLILDGILKSWLDSQNNKVSKAIITELDNVGNRRIQSIIHRILMILNIE